MKLLSEGVARKMTAEVLEGKVVVGHSLQNDFQALMLSHPHEHIRDTALFRPLRPPGRENRTPSLAGLVEHWFREKIHQGSHDSVEDARMALRLYRLKSRIWEKQLRSAMKGNGRPGDAVAGAVEEEEDDEGERVDGSRNSVGGEKGTRNMKKKKKRKAACLSDGDGGASAPPAGPREGARKGKKRR